MFINFSSSGYVYQLVHTISISTYVWNCSELWNFMGVKLKHLTEKVCTSWLVYFPDYVLYCASIWQRHDLPPVQPMPSVATLGAWYIICTLCTHGCQIHHGYISIVQDIIICMFCTFFPLPFHDLAPVWLLYSLGMRYWLSFCNERFEGQKMAL